MTGAPLSLRSKPGRLAIFTFVLCAVVLVPALLCAQSFRGTIRGQVRDASGALLARAKVSAKNNATGLTRETVTGAEGSYVMAELPAGVYIVMAQAAGLSPDRYLSDNNAYAFFDALGDLIHTGPTGTNVGDLQVILLA